MMSIEEKLKGCKSLSEAGRVLGYDYYNGKVKKLIVDYCKQIGVDIEAIVDSYKSRKVYCLNCGKEILGKTRFIKKFCSNSCSASFNNRLKEPKDSDEKRKIAESLKNTRIKNGFKTISECVLEGILLNPFNIQCGDKVIDVKRCSERECVVCGQKFRPFLSKSGRLTKTNTCSEECRRIKLGEAGKLGYQSQVDNGTFKGWQSRNILSFPEKFWINVLDNNNIKYVANKPFKGYFLDFYIEIGERKIDLEIDGGQHKLPDRALSDKIRDKVVKESGIEVYRIEWNEVDSDKGKEKMKEKIDMFLKFIG